MLNAASMPCVTPACRNDRCGSKTAVPDTAGVGPKLGEERKSMCACSGRGASAGVLDTPFGKFARLQVLTIEDLFAGKKPAMPPQDPAAFKKAAREEDKTLKLL